MSVAGLYLLQRVQGGSLPTQPDRRDGGAVGAVLQHRASFVTNTNWQNYGGESTMSHLTQMGGLAVQNFVSAAVGILRCRRARWRGLTRRRSETIGNFWVDLTRVTVRVLLPIATVVALAARPPGCRAEPERARRRATTVEGATQSTSVRRSPSRQAIKELGTNGGGIANANSAHPFENPTAFTNLIEMWAILAIPFALAFAFGRLVGDRRQGWAVFAAMFVLWTASAGLAMGFELGRQPAEIDSRRQSPNMEGKEVRYGAAASGLFAATHHGHINRRPSMRPHALHAARRRGSARQHDAWARSARAASARVSTGS